MPISICIMLTLINYQFVKTQNTTAPLADIDNIATLKADAVFNNLFCWSVFQHNSENWDEWFDSQTYNEIQLSQEILDWIKLKEACLKAIQKFWLAW